MTSPTQGEGGSAKRWHFSISLFRKMGEKGEVGIKSLKKLVMSFMAGPLIQWPAALNCFAFFRFAMKIQEKWWTGGGRGKTNLHSVFNFTADNMLMSSLFLLKNNIGNKIYKIISKWTSSTCHYLGVEIISLMDCHNLFQNLYLITKN